MNDKILKNQLETYGKNFKTHGPTPEGIYWNDTETQYLRFEHILNNIAPFISCSSIHDVGSGICDLHNYLLWQNIQHEYSGTEIVQEMIDYSLDKFPYIKLFNRNILTVGSDESYDYLVLSGTMNLLNNQDPKVWKEYCFKLIRKMYDMSRKAISFNCLTMNNTFSDPSLYYFNPTEVFEFCIKNLSRFVIIDQGYPLFEFTCTVFRPEFLADHFNSVPFLKYFNNLR
jgi:hypothetical protein